MTRGSGWLLKMFNSDIHHMAEQQVLTGSSFPVCPGFGQVSSGPPLSTFSWPINITAPKWHNKNTDETPWSHIRLLTALMSIQGGDWGLG